MKKRTNEPIPGTAEWAEQRPWLLHFLDSLPSADECWEWKGRANDAGYGMAGMELAHRRVYELFYGPIPNELHLHHRCGNPLCVNPRHVEVITPSAHGTISSKYSGRTHCSNGHEYTQENTVWAKPKGQNTPSRRCRACKREWDRRTYNRRSFRSPCFDGGDHVAGIEEDRA